MSHGEWSDGTRTVHAGLPEPVPGQPFMPGPQFAAPFAISPQGPGDGDSYGRAGNATLRALESAIGGLEGAPGCVVFSSGMAAVTGLLLSVLRPGDKVVVPADGYYLTRLFALKELAEFGIEVAAVPTEGPYDFTGVRLALLETPANPGLEVCDIAALSAQAHAAGALIAVDNTTATPLGQQPLVLGADFAVASGTKALTGHSDILLGYVAASSVDGLEAVRAWRTRTGALPGPFEAWLAHRSLGTLDLRLARQASNAGAAYELLRSSAAVRRAVWPGADPEAMKQLRRPPGVLVVEFADEETAVRFLSGCELIRPATSFGGLHSTADRRAQWPGETAVPGLVRLSCGCEDPADLLADLQRGLQAAE
ncbi:cystathionine gamma-lyase [Longispora albida]|uniref:cystathionine gamma-lyase n=1 Tax=Longispora albida TaxID=203523 RepID=UPI00037D02C4|nr:cystathionine gamma-lyase [Longispora albida]